MNPRIVSFLLFVAIGTSTYGERPVSTDDRLRLTLFAEDPDIVTPIGMAIDRTDRVFVIESHTHHPPSDYDGPKSDRIKVFRDTDHDGRADSVSVFADGLHQAMNLAFSPEGDLYVVCARQVVKLVDGDKDGICDSKQQILKLETKQRYAHNSLLSITFDRDGWMYVGRGNTGSDAYRLVASDESDVKGYGDGGNVIRCRPDGSEITEFATGFWNPFDIKFDRFGRLLMVDNDPDARGPNRLLQVVEKGDYGYKSVFGGSGTHPMQGWDGELPGTLPFIAGTGEAPSGLIDGRRTSFPVSYADSIFATIWNENTIERFVLDRDTCKLEEKSVLVRGGKDFRPVALDCNTRGDLFFTDWVRVDYPNHGRGRIWRLASKDSSPLESIKPEGYFQAYGTSIQQQRFAEIRSADVESLRREFESGASSDPFDLHVAAARLSTEPVHVRERLGHGSTNSRMVALWAHKLAEVEPKRYVEFFTDSSPDIRRFAVLQTAMSMDSSLKGSLQKAVSQSPVTVELFETYLAAEQILSPSFANAFNSRTHRRAKDIPRTVDESLLVRTATNHAMPSTVRALAVSRLRQPTDSEELSLILSMLDDADDAIVIAAIEAARHLADKAIPGRPQRLVEIASEESRSDAVRTKALAALAGSIKIQSLRDSGLASEALSRLNSLTESNRRRVAVQAIRTRREVLRQPRPANPDRPNSDQTWRLFLQQGGDPELGRHVFGRGAVGCNKCHSLNGFGGTLGPGLSGLGNSKTREAIIDSILNPSAQFAPQYQAWSVLTTDGILYRGVQLDHKANDAIVLTLDSGENRYFKAEDIDDYRAMPTSLMPDGLEDLMTADEFRDLVAFLASLRD